MKKKLLIFLSLLMLSIALVGCEDSYNDDPDFVYEIHIADRTFKVIPGYAEGYGNYNLMVDTETKVQYLHDDGAYGGGFTVILDADGKPILYEGVLE